MQDKRSVSISGTVLASQDGVALLMVLWALTILSAIVLSFSLMARTEAYSSASFRATVANRFLAEAGVERGTNRWHGVFRKDRDWSVHVQNYGRVRKDTA
jgi:type II secretory pathway component PulK